MNSSSHNFLVLAYVIGLVLLWGYAITLFVSLKKISARLNQQDELDTKN